MTRIRVNPELLTWARVRALLVSLALAGQLGSGTLMLGVGTHE